LKKCVVRTASALVRSLPGGIHLASQFLLIQRNLPVAASAGTAGAFTISNREADGAASLAEMIAHTWRTSLIRLVLRADSISSAAIEIGSRERIACCSFLALSRYR
jgi:hypothetical protein